MLNQSVLPLRPAKAEPLLALAEAKSVDDLGQAVRAAVVHAVERGLQQHRGAGEAEHDQRIDEHREHRELHLARFDLLAEIFGRAADHQPRDEHRDDRENQEAVEARADAARPDAAGEKVEHRHHAGRAGSASCASC